MIVNVGSILGHRGIPDCAEYCASKLRCGALANRCDPNWPRSGSTSWSSARAPRGTEFFDSAIDAEQRRLSRQGMEPSAVARRTVRAIRRGKHEIVVGASAKLLVWGSRFFPRLLDRILARSS